jgi:hypothetical protein
LGGISTRTPSDFGRQGQFNSQGRGQYGQGAGQFNNNQNQGGRGGDREQYQGQNRAYVQKSVTTSSGEVSTGQNKVADERRTISATTVAASSGTTHQVHIRSSSETELAGRKSTLNDNLICNKCGKKVTFTRTALKKLSVSIVAKDINP